MPPYETRSSQFGLVSGIRQPRSDMVLVAEPAGLFAPEARKGQLYIVAEADQDVARGRDACQLVTRTIRKQFYDDSSYSVTSSLRKAISAANKALYEHNFSVLAQKRAVVGVTCAVVKGNDLYIAQVAPSQAYVLASGKLRALPTNLSWNPAQSGAASFLKPNAIGASLSIEPDFYRAMLRPGDAMLLCSSNLSRMLGQEEVLRLLRSPGPTEIADGLVAICKQNALHEAHGVAAAVCAPLSPAAQASPLSRAGISERGMIVLRSVGGWATRVTGEAALMIKGPAARAQRRKTEQRLEQARLEQVRLAELPEDPQLSPAPPPPPLPLDLGEPLDQRVAQDRRERHGRLEEPGRRAPDDGGLPPSSFLGESGYTAAPPPERRIDLSDTPSMAALGRRPRAPGDRAAMTAPTLGDRLSQPFVRASNALTSMSHRRRLRRPPPSAMPHMRRQQGLSYRRQGPPFPWRWLAMIVLFVTVLVLYGMNLSREVSQRHTDDTLDRAERAVAAVRDAPDEATAQGRLDAAAVALADLRSTGTVTATLESRQRYDTLQRDYERALASLQKLTYFDNLTEIAQHPVPGGLFTSVVVPPPPQGITNTAAFASIYLLDANAGVLYQMPRSGGKPEPLLQPDDTLGALVVGKIKTQAWREDNIVALAQNGEAGSFTFFFRNGENWGHSNLAGSEEWGRVGEQFRAANYGGNLYIWGAGSAAPGQVLKYPSGHYGEFPSPWIQKNNGPRIDNAVDLAVDGNIYLLQPDGHIQVFAANAWERELIPQGINPPLVTVANFFVTGDPETGAIFLVDTYNQRIIQIDKQTGALIQQIRARPDSPVHLDRLISMYVDTSVGRPVLYLVNGGQILRGSLPDQPRPFRAASTPSPSGTSSPPGTPSPTP